MLDIDDIEALIEQYHNQAVDAWAGMTETNPHLPTVEGIRPFARPDGVSLARVWAGLALAYDVSDEFVAALRGQGVVIPGDDLPLDQLLWADHFQSRAKSFRCLVRKNGAPAGSGIIVGPTSVLTAWHVIAVQGPGLNQEPAPRIDVELPDGRWIPAQVPVLVHSECGSSEYPSGLPASDAEVLDKSDVALLTLSEAVGLRLPFPQLGAQQNEFPGPKAVAVVQYPGGKYLGIGSGRLCRLRTLTARWGHSVASAGGSSGGGCFDTEYRLIGIHQGQATRKRGRMVPVGRFPQHIIDGISADEIPQTLWSLDGTLSTSLVIGRDHLFRAYHAVMRSSERAKGIWIRRTNLRDTSGLGFTFQIIERLVARSRTTRLVRISFDTLIEDHPEEIARRVREANIDVQAPTPAHGVGHNETEPEAVAADRSRRLASLINDQARERGIVLWLFFDHPNVLFGDEPRWAVTAFADQALKLDSLRVIIAGYEAVQMAGERFQQLQDATGPGGPGRIIEYLNGFSLGEVADSIVAAIEGSGCSISEDRALELAEEAVEGLVSTGGRYSSWMAGTVDEWLRPRIARIVRERPPSPLTGPEVLG